ESVQVNDGSAQRSMVTSLRITFNGEVTLDPGAISLTRLDGLAVNLSLATQAIAGRTVAMVTFTGAGIVGGSLADGDYTLTIRRDKVHTSSASLAQDATRALFRLFGDSDGDHDVDARDMVAFARTLGSHQGQDRYLAAFDYNGDSSID